MLPVRRVLVWNGLDTNDARIGDIFRAGEHCFVKGNDKAVVVPFGATIVFLEFRQLGISPAAPLPLVFAPGDRGGRTMSVRPDEIVRLLEEDKKFLRTRRIAGAVVAGISQIFARPLRGWNPRLR